MLFIPHNKSLKTANWNLGQRMTKELTQQMVLRPFSSSNENQRQCSDLNHEGSKTSLESCRTNQNGFIHKYSQVCRLNQSAFPTLSLPLTFSPSLVRSSKAMVIGTTLILLIWHDLYSMYFPYQRMSLCDGIMESAAKLELLLSSLRYRLSLSLLTLGGISNVTKALNNNKKAKGERRRLQTEVLYAKIRQLERESESEMRKKGS